MTQAQIREALAEAQIVLAAITELGERIAAGAVDDGTRDELATDLYFGAARLAAFAGQVAA
jgi:hypothetical protein